MFVRLVGWCGFCFNKVLLSSQLEGVVKPGVVNREECFTPCGTDGDVGEPRFQNAGSGEAWRWGVIPVGQAEPSP